MTAGAYCANGPLLGPTDQTNFLTQTFRQLAAGKPVQAAAARMVSPTYVPDLVRARVLIRNRHIIQLGRPDKR